MKTQTIAAAALLLTACGSTPSTGDGGSDAVADAPSMGDSGPPSAYVSPTCVDGMYTETLPNVTAPIGDVTFAAPALTSYYDTVLGRRYPIGDAIMRGGQMNTSVGDCVQQFSGSPTTASAALRTLETVVHECGHLYDALLSTGLANTNVYHFTSTTQFACARGDTTTRGGDTFARSLIRSDVYSASRPPCGGSASPTCDNYADIYLNGDPNDTVFDSGDQGFNMLLEEDVQYINSLATSWAFVDQLQAGESTSARDGILTFLWYVERYLHMARLMYPTAYTRLSTDACWRDAILTVWGRAWLYLHPTQGVSALGISDAALMPLVTTPELLDEINRIRVASGCR